MKGPLPRLHAVTDERIAHRPDLDQLVAELASAGGADLALHARGRALTGLEHYGLSCRLSVLPSPLFVNDRLDVALAVGASGVQLGHGSLAPEHARCLNPTWWIGKSVHGLAEAEAARAEGADYLLAGPVFATATHPNREPLGLGVLRQIAGLGLPVVAIGGVTPERVKGITAAGAHGVAAIRALWDAADPAEAARRMLAELSG